MRKIGCRKSIGRGSKNCCSFGVQNKSRWAPSCLAAVHGLIFPLRWADTDISDGSQPGAAPQPLPKNRDS